MATTVSIDANGITAPSYNDILTYLQTSYKGIYGSDVDLDPDTQDGQLLAIFASAINDANSMAVAVYNSFSPATAQGAGLSSVIKINGIARAIASYSTVDVDLVGQAGTTINSGKVQDTTGYTWDLPASVTIQSGGTITVTAKCETQGAISAAIGTVTSIATPTRGWQSVTNSSVATAGAAVETDAALRQRQTTSVALPSTTVLEGIIGAVANIVGVTRYKAYENDTDATDGNSIPSHSIALVVEGGDAQTIADTIAEKKTPGSGTYGSTTETVVDAYGIAHSIKFSRPTEAEITVGVTVTALTGYTTTIENEIKQAVSDYINALAIGDPVRLTRLYVPANLSNDSDGSTFELTGLQIAKNGGDLGSSDISIAFDEAATCSTDLVTVTAS